MRLSQAITRKLDASSSSGAIRILVVDDHPLVRMGLAQLLQREGDLTICGEAEDHRGAVEAVASSKPDLAIVDLVLKQSDGLELIKDMHARFPTVLVLAISVRDELLYAERALRAGASGFVSKQDAAANIVEAIRLLLRGEVYVSQRVASRLGARMVGRARAGSNPSLEALTDRELQVLDLIAEGFGRRQIAERLHLDINTIETYRARIKQRLRIKDALELRQYAIRSGVRRDS
jgi:DNA-binding NarL/FixJ family response regulator